MKFIAFFIAVVFLTGCSESFMDEPHLTLPPEIAVNEPSEPVMLSEEYIKKCYRREYYFCPGVGGPLYRIEILKNICKDPPEIISVSECEEFLECDPSQFKMGEEDCVTDQGLPGTKTIYCDKGYIKEGKCETECVEEICDGVDNNCDGLIDEGQLNSCNECGPEKSEICNDIDDDCDGETDEDLIRPCNTTCEAGYETCVNGIWGSCTAQQPSDEICDGFDNDCDGDIDEGLNCLCTIQDIGTLFPCEEDPLICGSGYKTCECKTPNCSLIGFTPCLAMCSWMLPIDPNCDPFLGKVLPYELCNNHDDNCNQLIDEDLFDLCYTGPPETMNVGTCEAGMVTCFEGQWGHYNDSGNFLAGYCKDEVLPQPEDLCNGLDEDCDGKVDQDKEMQDTDILLIVDWSGSMTAEIEAVLIALNQFAKNYKDEDVIKWGLIVGPRVPGVYGSNNYLELVNDLSSFEDFMSNFSSLNKNTMNRQFEMFYDALYLSLLELSASKPWQLDEMTWTKMVGNAIQESIPELENFKINWRPNAKRVIIIFSDEPGQSYMIPKSILGGSWNSNYDGVTQSILLNMIATSPDTVIYTFSNYNSKNSSMPFGQTAWEPLALESSGKWYELKHNPTDMYVNLMEIIDKEVCGEK